MPRPPESSTLQDSPGADRVVVREKEEQAVAFVIVILSLIAVGAIISSAAKRDRRASTLPARTPFRTDQTPRRTAPPQATRVKQPLKHTHFEPSRVQLNDEFRAALHLIEHEGASLFLTGRAGTGKSTFVQYLMSTTKKRAVVLAPTGIAALAAGGQTIHSFFGFPPRLLDDRDILLHRDRAMIQKLDLLVLDEASMISANLMDAVDKTLRRNRGNLSAPFGGAQVICVGDLFQLPPVVKKPDEDFFRKRYGGQFFFRAPAFHGLPVGMLTFETVHRQTDDDFLRILSGIREANIDALGLRTLNGQVRGAGDHSVGDAYITLTPRRNAAQDINEERLQELPGPVAIYKGRVSGRFRMEDSLAEEILQLKPGARVMMLNNDSGGRWVNGSAGTVTRTGPHTVMVSLDDGEHDVDVEPCLWESVKYVFDSETGRIQSAVEGTLRQLPLKLAWALTIHKSQGQAIQHVRVDLGSGAFAHGQTYVALSRCPSLAGLALSRPIRKTDLILDRAVFEYRKVFHPISTSAPASES